MERGKYFDELKVGDKFLSLKRTITEADVVNFVTTSGMYEDMFMNVEFVEKESIFKKRIVPGVQLLAIAQGLNTLIGWTRDTGMGWLGLDEVRAVAPVAIGDTIQVEVEIANLRESRTPGRGVCTDKHTLRNQRGEVVTTYYVNRMMRMKPAS